MLNILEMPQNTAPKRPAAGHGPKSPSTLDKAWGYKGSSVLLRETSLGGEAQLLAGRRTQRHFLYAAPATAGAQGVGPCHETHTHRGCHPALGLTAKCSA